MRSKRSILLTIIMAIVVVGLFSGNANTNGCSSSVDPAERAQAEATSLIMTEINNQIGLPNLDNYYQKRMMKLIYELCDQENLICYAYLQAEYSGKLVYVGRCMGYGIPFSAQYTNPEKPYRRDYHDTPMMPQADPNGLYMPTSSSATWLMMLDENDEPRVVYFEPTIVVSPFKLPT